VGYHVPSGLHPDFPAVAVLVDLLTDAPSGRLYKALIDTKKASNLYGYVFQTKDPSFPYFHIELLKEKSLDSARSITLDVLENLAKNPVTKEEVERIKNQLLKNIELSLNDANRIGLEMSENIALGDWRMFFYSRDQLRKVTPADVQRVAETYFKASNRTLGLFIPTTKPERAEIPVASEASVILKDYKGGQAVAQGEAFDPSTANIDARTQKSEIGGVKMSLLTKKTRGSSVFVRMTMRFGDEKSLFGKGTAANYAAQMLMKGTNTMTRQQIKDEFDRLKAKVFVFGGGNQVSVNIETTKDNLLAVSRLVSQVLRDPAFPADEFDKAKQEDLAQIESQKSEPTSKVQEALGQMMNVHPRGDVRYQSSLSEQVEDIKKVTLDEVKAFYKGFYGASNATMSIVGDFDEKALKDSLTKYYGAWKSPKPFSRIVSKHTELKAQSKSIEAPDKANAFFLAVQPIKLNENDPEYPALIMANYIMGGGFLNSRLATRIRQKEGISYGVGSQLSGSSLDDQGMFLTYAIYAPENAERLEAAYKEEIDKVLKDGFTQKELDDARKGYLQNRLQGRANDNELVGKLNNNTYLGRTMTWDEDFETKIKNLTPEQLATAVKKFIDPAKISIVKSGDFEGAAKKKAGNAGAVEVPKK
jgi:zinc protease